LCVEENQVACRLIKMLIAALAATIHVLAAAGDPPWPAKQPIRIIVPGGTGGVIDIRARWLAVRLAPVLGQNVIVENKPGAGGNIGTEIGAHSAADGYTLTIIHTGTMTVNPHLYIARAMTRSRTSPR
jgi:tripartite-type tricarboxylate transporter receptor subunit TctC